MKRPVLLLNGVTLFREGKKVLDGINWTILPGEHWVLLGPNGSGKSSLVGMLQGILWPIEGCIEVLGRRFGAADITAMRKCIGWVGNEIEPEFPANQRVEDIVLSGCVGTVGLKFDRPSVRDRAKAKGLLGELGLLEFRARPFPLLSQGQRRLVTIARALMTRPGLLLLDEPCSGLDPVSREIFLEKLETIMAFPGGPAVLYITHHVEEIVGGISHAMLLREGKILEMGPTDICISDGSMRALFSHPVTIRKHEGRFTLRLG